MLNEKQQQELESVVRSIKPDLRIESASLDAQQTLEVVLCRDFVCFRPLQVVAGDVNVHAALAGEAEAQQALQMHLRTALKGMM